MVRDDEEDVLVLIQQMFYYSSNMVDELKPECRQIISVIALGSNIDDRLEWLRCGMDAWRRIDRVEVVSVSRIYESPPVGENIDGDFLNAVFVIGTTLTPDELLRTCHEVEGKCGRDRSVEKIGESRNRTLDCDVIFYEDTDIDSAELITPHPEWQDRAFVVMPLIDVIEHLTPHQSQIVQEAAKSLDLDSASCRPIDSVLDLR